MDLECLRCFSVLIALYATEDNVLIRISSCCGLEDGLESHAGWACWRPEVNYDASIVLDDLLEVDETRDLHHLTELRSHRSLPLHRLSSHSTWHALSASHLLHELLHLWIVSHLLHHLRIHSRHPSRTSHAAWHTLWRHSHSSTSHSSSHSRLAFWLSCLQLSL